MKKAVLPVLLFATAACAATEGPVSPGPDRPQALPATPEGDMACEGVFRWLQSDAYAEVAGRNNKSWPPHTTTVFEAWCQVEGSRELIERFVMLNHGGDYERVDPRGRLVLEEVRRETKTGTREEILALGRALRGCECRTEFLGTATVEAGVESELIEALSRQAEESLECRDTAALPVALEALRTRDLDLAVGALATCTWRGGGSTAAFDRALVEAGGELETYHVCNNDARLQASVWARFTPGEEIPACEVGTEACRGPLWFYSP